MSWWSRTYNRPLKDPLLLSYSLEELIYEYYDHVERDKAAEETQAKKTDRIEEEKAEADDDWADAMERQEEEEAIREAEKIATEKNIDPAQDPANIKWMEDQIKKDKELHGEDFGDDVDIEF